VRGRASTISRTSDVAFPLGAFVTVTGVSGSGKSSLVNEVLYHTLARRLHRVRTPAAIVDDVLGLEQVDKVINGDQIEDTRCTSPDWRGANCRLVPDRR